MNIETQIRHLARSNYFQQIYNSSKNCSGIRLFKNDYNFSGIQYLMLHWLRTYALLYEELANLEWENLDEEVINDDYRCNAFLYWRSKHIEKKLREAKKEEKKSGKKKGFMGLPIFKGIKDKEGTE